MAKYDAMFDPRKHNRPGTYAKRVVVFKRGKDLIVRKYVKPGNPRTAGQVASRQKLVTASRRMSQTWALLSEDEKERCRLLAHRRGLATGFMAFTQLWWEKKGKVPLIRAAWGKKMGRQLSLNMKEKARKK